MFAHKQINKIADLSNLSEKRLLTHVEFKKTYNIEINILLYEGLRRAVAQSLDKLDIVTINFEEVLGVRPRQLLLAHTPPNG